MKIAIDISQIAYKGTGVATYTENLVKTIAKIDRKNHYLLFGSSLRNTKYLKNFCEGFKKYPNFSYKIFRLPPSFLSLLWNKMHVLSIDRLIGKVDVLHTSDWLEPPSSASKVTTIHDLVIFVTPENTPKPIISTQLGKLSWVKKETKKIIAVSHSTKKDIINFLKIPENKIEVIYEAASDKFKRMEDEKQLLRVKEKYSLPDKFFLVVGVGLRKNLENIIAAFDNLNQNIHLIITGRKGKQDNKSIKEIGFVEEKELATLYSLAQALVYVPTYEGFGLPVLEALSCGCQVVTANSSSLPEVGDEAVFYADPQSPSDISRKMEQVLKNPKPEEVLLAQAKKFSWEKAAKETVKMYESLS